MSTNPDTGGYLRHTGHEADEEQRATASAKAAEASLKDAASDTLRQRVSAPRSDAATAL